VALAVAAAAASMAEAVVAPAVVAVVDAGKPVHRGNLNSAK
jgi:hypothetical protein